MIRRCSVPNNSLGWSLAHSVIGPNQLPPITTFFTIHSPFLFTTNSCFLQSLLRLSSFSPYPRTYATPLPRIPPSHGTPQSAQDATPIFTLLLDGAKRMLLLKKPSGSPVEKLTATTNFPTPPLRTPMISFDSTSVNPSTFRTLHGTFKAAAVTTLVAKAPSWHFIRFRLTTLLICSCSVANLIRTLMLSFQTDRTQPGR